MASYVRRYGRVPSRGLVRLWLGERPTLLRRFSRWPSYEDCEMALIRRGQHKMDGKDGTPAVMACPPDLEAYEGVWDFLSVTTWPDDKKPRATGSVLLFCDQAGLKCRLQDNDAELVAFALLDLSQSVWASIDAMLLSTQTDWRPSGRPGGRRK